MQGKAALREKFCQRLATDGKIIQMLQPVSLNAAIADRRAKDKRQIDEVMQTCGKQNAFRERIGPNTDQTAGLQKILELHNGMLYSRPYHAEDKGQRNHHRKTYRHDKSRPLENPQPVGNIRIIETVVQIRGHAGDKDGTEHAHIERLDIGNHGQPRPCACCLTIIHAEICPMQRQEPGNKIVEQHVDDETFHRAAGWFLFRKADRYGYRKENGHLGKYRPGSLFHHKPKIIPYCALSGYTPQYALILTDNG